MTTTMATDDENVYDPASEVKQFDASKMGVKGLVDSGVTSIPRFFINPPEKLSDLHSQLAPPELSNIIPTIDLSGARPAIVEQISRAARDIGFFQIVNFGIPVGVLDRTIATVKAFHEQPSEMKARFYGRRAGPGVSFFSNYSLLHSNAANWRDTLQVRVGPEVEEIPEICREPVVEWDRESKRLGELLMGLLCEGLGLESSKLKDMGCTQGGAIVGQYYPFCPQPDLTVGIGPHTDPGLLTILLQDHVGGLQIKHGDTWVDVKPQHGVLVINIGDAFQIMSNGIYTSVKHRVVANSFPDPRVSIAVFFHPADRDTIYAPFPEILSPERPPLFGSFNYSDYIQRSLYEPLNGNSLVDYYRL